MEEHLLPSSGMTADKYIIVAENYCQKNMLMSYVKYITCCCHYCEKIWLLATVSPFSSFTCQVFANIHRRR